MPEVRPIDANALLKKCIEGDGDNKFTEGYNFAVQEISAYIALAPTIEAEPVRHGRWMNTNETVWDAKDIDGKKQLDISIVSAKCSVCGRWAEQVNNFTPYMKYNFCPICGARMDGGADNDSTRID